MMEKKWHIEDKGKYILVINEGGATLGYSKKNEISILEDDGYAFKDLNQNGVLDPYEDWRLPVEERVRDLLKQMDLDSKLGLSLHDGMFMVMHMTEEALASNRNLRARVALMGKTAEELAVMDPTEPTDYHKELIEHDEMRCWLMGAIEGPEYAAEFNNKIQEIAEGHKYGIPVYFSTNPRAFQDAHSDTTNRDVSKWPSNLGMGATFDPGVAQHMAELVSQEYRAMGITMELGPQIDLASDPRWNRMNATYGANEKLNADMARAVCDGLQTTVGEADGWGKDSVLAMCKHWPGSTGEGGRESHNESGKYSVYPGGNFEKHIFPWTGGAFQLNGPTGQCGGVMSAYDEIWEVGGEEAEISGASFNKYVVETVLRRQNDFRGFVCTDFWITGNKKKERTTRPQVNAWGYQDVTPEERALKEWESGVDQCGGTNEIEIMRGAYQLAQKKHGPTWADNKINEIASRVLTYGFRVGSFENPYVDKQHAMEFVGNEAFREEGLKAHRKSVVLLKNKGVLPLDKNSKVFVADKGRGGVPDRAGHVDTITVEKPIKENELREFCSQAAAPKEADCAIVFMDTPNSGNGFDRKNREIVPISLQYRPYTALTAREENIAGDYVDGVKENRSYRGKSTITYNEYDLDNLLEVKKQMGDKPVIVVLNCTNSVVPSEFEPYADAVLVTFSGTPNKVVLEALTGAFEPSTLLPFQMPASMEAVEAHMEDTPGDICPYTDSEGHSWDFGYGMNWEGVIADHRVDKYR
ncbi:MAG: glycoside hydrolase family 3 C-terminal domain-containing protein [Lachnospiraceae bacterium]|nr:glycoside hydrolase family 3 C-terminal domain-containing protein [Lachnospiraceae bacterium]